MTINLVALNMFSGAIPPVFHETILVVEQALNAAGFQTKKSVNSIHYDSPNIIWGIGTNFSFPLQQIADNCPPSSCIIFNMENLLSDSPIVSDEYLNLLRNYLVLDYNQANVDFLNAQATDPQAYEFPIIPTSSLSEQYRDLDFRLKPTFDVAFFGAMNDRRKLLLEAIATTGLKTKIIKAFGRDLAQELLECKIVINVHYYEPGLLETARCLIPQALGIPVVSELSIMPGTVDWRKSGMMFTEYHALPNLCLEILKTPEKLLQLSKLAGDFRLNDHIIPQITKVMTGVVKQLYSSAFKKS